MVMASFVYVGEYSDACVCKPREKGTAAGDGSGAAAAGAVAVITEMRAIEAAQQAAAAHH
jgi:hypothetical protein